ncbi:uncharacterized protein LOC107304222 isoform X1 [Oryza brachyantha]|uniref:uncharacterized protein LOC107304222 isoform X1 n=1 Tax=Oryza brachyantha TaxID=4533 RepID=UPI00077688CD|nr:uncharacterized protein LOC107304222 isoform X1 [Oryza brachyantha]
MVDQQGTTDNQGAIKDGNTLEFQELVLVQQDVIQERGQTTQDIAVEDQNKAVENSVSGEFRGTMDNYAMGYLEVVEHDLIDQSGETVDGIAVDDQVKEVEHGVIRERSETTDCVAIKDQEQVMEQFASYGPRVTKDNIIMDHQVLVVQSVIDERVEDQRRALQQCIIGKLRTTENNNVVEDSTMVEQSITDEFAEAMGDIAVEDQEMTLVQCTNDELEGTENYNALEDRVSEQGAIYERGAYSSTEDQENAVEQCAGDVANATKVNNVVPVEEKAVEQDGIGKEDIAMKDQEEAMEQCGNDELRTSKNEKVVEGHKVEEQGVIDENLAELSINDEPRITKDVIAFQDQGKMFEQRVGNEQVASKGKFAIQDNMEVVDHVCHEWDTTEDDLAIDVAASVGTNAISFSEDLITLNDNVSGWGMVKENVKVCVAYPQRPGKLNCHFYLSTGSCSYGLSCNFNHPRLKAKPDISSFPSEQENYGATGILELNRVGLPIIEGARNCSYYMRNGTCSYGKKCHFNHPEQVIDSQFDPPTGWDDDAFPSSALSKKSHDHANPDDTSYFKRSSSHVASDKKSSVSMVLPPNILRMLLPPEKVPPSTEEKVMKVNKDINWTAASDDSSGCSADSTGRALGKQEHVNYLERPGRRPECPFYTRFGDCKFASACKYDHSKDRFTNRSSAASDKSNGCHSADSLGGALCKQKHVDYPERPGRPECPFYMRFGDCKFASACKYHHSKDRQGEELVEHPERPGEPECPFYMKNGYCKFGVECKFHHLKGSIPSRWSPKDIKGPVAPKEHHPASKIKLQDHMYQQDQYPERPGQPDCRYYMQFGKCKYWSACIFHHPKDRLSNGCHPSEETVPKQEEHTEHALYPERPGELECFYYMRHGSCKFQRNCKYHHPKDRLSNKSCDPAFD